MTKITKNVLKIPWNEHLPDYSKGSFCNAVEGSNILESDLHFWNGDIEVISVQIKVLDWKHNNPIITIWGRDFMVGELFKAERIDDASSFGHCFCQFFLLSIISKRKMKLSANHKWNALINSFCFLWIYLVTPQYVQKSTAHELIQTNIKFVFSLVLAIHGCHCNSKNINQFLNVSQFWGKTDWKEDFQRSLFKKKRKHLHENTHSRALIIPLSSVFQNWWGIREEKNLCHFIAPIPCSTPWRIRDRTVDLKKKRKME